MRNRRESEPVERLIGHIERFGQGVTEPLWDRLGELKMPVDVVVGAEDTKYVEIGEQLVAAIPHARMVIVEEAGHAPHLEAPDAFVAEISPPT